MCNTQYRIHNTQHTTQITHFRVVATREELHVKGEFMKVLTIANQKGGVGKTTTAQAILDGLAERGARVLGIDHREYIKSLVWFLWSKISKFANTIYC